MASLIEYCNAVLVFELVTRRASIQKIQKEYDSSIIKLELENKQGITFYEVEPANDQGLIIDVASGEIIPKKRDYHG